MVSDNNPDLSKGTLELKPNETYISGSSFDALHGGVIRFVPSVSSRNYYLNGQYFSTTNAKLLLYSL